VRRHRAVARASPKMPLGPAPATSSSSAAPGLGAVPARSLRECPALLHPRHPKQRPSCSSSQQASTRLRCCTSPTATICRLPGTTTAVACACLHVLAARQSPLLAAACSYVLRSPWLCAALTLAMCCAHPGQSDTLCISWPSQHAWAMPKPHSAVAAGCHQAGAHSSDSTAPSMLTGSAARCRLGRCLQLQAHRAAGGHPRGPGAHGDGGG
jgi:hypothetical protein